jgi:hypothetical protein
MSDELDEKPADVIPIGTPRKADGKWLPGHSGNPGGKPKVSPELKATRRTRGEEAEQFLYELMRNRRASTKERRQAAEYLHAIAFGRPTTQIAGAEDGAPITFANQAADDAALLEKLRRMAKPSAEPVSSSTPDANRDAKPENEH